MMKILKQLYRASLCSKKGFYFAFKTQLPYRIEITVLLAAVPISFWLGKGAAEKLLLFSSVFLVLIAETINTAIEAVVNRIGLEQHPLSGAAKDLGSLAVLLTIINALVIWCYLLVVRLFG